MRKTVTALLLATICSASLADQKHEQSVRRMNELAKSSIKSGFVPPADILGAASPGSVPMTLQEAMDKYATRVRKEQGATRVPPRILVFVSFSMPLARLESYVNQAREMGGVLVLRGLHEGSLKKTTAKALESTPKGDVPWLIHPEWFQQFEVDKVPAIVIANQDGMNPSGDVSAPESFAKVYGDVSLELALRTIRERGNKAMAAMARERLEKLAKERK